MSFDCARRRVSTTALPCQRSSLLKGAPHEPVRPHPYPSGAPGRRMGQLCVGADQGRTGAQPGRSARQRRQAVQRHRGRHGEDPIREGPARQVAWAAAWQLRGDHAACAGACGCPVGAGVLAAGPDCRVPRGACQRHAAVGREGRQRGDGRRRDRALQRGHRRSPECVGQLGGGPASPRPRPVPRRAGPRHALAAGRDHVGLAGAAQGRPPVARVHQGLRAHLQQLRAAAPDAGPASGLHPDPPGPRPDTAPPAHGPRRHRPPCDRRAGGLPPGIHLHPGARR